MDPQLRRLKNNILAMEPLHDTEVGRVHPYWARKPMNVLRSILQGLGSEGDIVVDPFMGSGTTLFASLQCGMRAIGSDLNPLSVFLVKSILEISSQESILLPEIQRIVQEFKKECLPWFEYSGNEYVERERYSVVGQYAHGDFTLHLEEVVTKRQLEDGWSQRKSYIKDIDFDVKFKSQHNEVDFHQIKLIPNSRIAIPQGASLGDYFTPRNQAAINSALKIIKSSTIYNDFPNALMLILSSSLPLLRLSDKKASSQWPYWRPRANLTSRNPVIVMGERLRAIDKLATWANKNLPKDALAENIKELSPEYRHIAVYGHAVQDLPKNVGKDFADIVLTDPPYGDQVPYIEYSAMWTEILGLNGDQSKLKVELVKSDSPGRRADTADYLNRLKDGFRSCAELLKDGGWMVWFYQDHSLESWRSLHQSSIEHSTYLHEIIPIPKQRRSMKTVTSPKRTLDGDLICVFRKNRKPPTVEASPYRAKNESEEFFYAYANMINNAMKDGSIEELAQKFKTVRQALNKVVMV